MQTHADTRKVPETRQHNAHTCSALTYEDTYSALGTRKYVQLQTKPSKWTIQCSRRQLFDTCRHMKLHTLLLNPQQPRYLLSNSC
jgi:hypothetical protein